ncbi:hypothetical protein G5714_000169 [Onychostoma macrolepis]|uniref:Immunoglobulin domain-containing protein n=1 Tax=Onychostoma macrolepis TaxID=369639 RepID=A0A7J6DFK4_9TELE|nr:hypothetical protein G5714_000169 [Onychostoma macrolepis]
MADAGQYGCGAGWGNYKLIQLNVIKAPQKTRPVQISTSTLHSYTNSSTDHTSTDLSSVAGGLGSVLLVLVLCSGTFLVLKKRKRKSGTGLFQQNVQHSTESERMYEEIPNSDVIAATSSSNQTPASHLNTRPQVSAVYATVTNQQPDSNPSRTHSTNQHLYSCCWCSRNSHRTQRRETRHQMPYKSGYESNSKYFCKGKCNFRNKIIIVKSGSPAKDKRFSLTDDKRTRVFTVSITDLRSTDHGQYWCDVERTVYFNDVYSEIVLLVKQMKKTTKVSTISSFSTAPSYFSTTEPNLRSSSITITERNETITDQHESAVVVGAPETVTGHRGERLDIRCSYESGYESNSKYFCKGECIFGLRNIIVKSGSPAEDERLSLTDDTTARVFTVSITDLRTTDQGLYWCGVKRTLTTDVYSEILLLVKLDNKTTEVPTNNPFTITPSYFSTSEQNQQSSSITITERKKITDQYSSSTESVIYVSVGLVVMLVIFLTALTVLCRKRSKKSPRVTQSGLSPQVSVVLLHLNEHTAEDIDCNNHKYEEINKLQGKNRDITTIYTTADGPDDSMIYSTAESPDDSTIYSTADRPDDSVIYSTADSPDDSTIYSTADRPDDSVIYSTAESPDDSTV